MLPAIKVVAEERWAFSGAPELSRLHGLPALLWGSRVGSGMGGGLVRVSPVSAQGTELMFLLSLLLCEHKLSQTPNEGPTAGTGGPLVHRPLQWTIQSSGVWHWPWARALCCTEATLSPGGAGKHPELSGHIRLSAPARWGQAHLGWDAAMGGGECWEQRSLLGAGPRQVPWVLCWALSKRVTTPQASDTGRGRGSLGGGRALSLFATSQHLPTQNAP